MQLHTDQLAITPPTRDIAFGMNIMFYLEDVTDENGATRVYPASHLGNIAPSNIFTVVSSAPSISTPNPILTNVFPGRLHRCRRSRRHRIGVRKSPLARNRTKPCHVGREASDSITFHALLRTAAGERVSFASQRSRSEAAGQAESVLRVSYRAWNRWARGKHPRGLLRQSKGRCRRCVASTPSRRELIMMINSLLIADLATLVLQ